jgi:hypothetical protein
MSVDLRPDLLHLERAIDHAEDAGSGLQLRRALRDYSRQALPGSVEGLSGDKINPVAPVRCVAFQVSIELQL